MPKKLPKGAFGGMADKVNAAKKTDKGTKKIRAGVRTVMKHPRYPGKN